MVTNKIKQSIAATESTTSKWQNVVNRLKSAVKPSNVATEIDYYHHYVYPTKFEDTVEAAINHLPKKEGNRA